MENDLPKKYKNHRRESQAFLSKAPGRTPGATWHMTHRCRKNQSLIQKAIRVAVSKAGLTKRVSCRTFRHSFATHLLESGYDIRTIQELLEHKDVSTTMMYTHVLNKGGKGVSGPLDGF